MTIKKLIASTVSSRETGQRRRGEGKTTNSQLHTTTQGHQGSDRCTSEGGSRQKLKQVDGDFPACTRRENNNNEDKKEKNWGSERKRSRQTRTLQCWWRRATVFATLRWRRQRQQQQKNSKERMVSGSSVSNSMKKDIRSKLQAKAKNCAAILVKKEKPRKWKSKKQRHHFHRVAKKHEINTLRWKNRGNCMRTRRLQMRWTINEGNVEARHVRNLGETPKTHVHGCRKIWQQTRSWNCAEQEVAATNYRYRIHQRTGHHCHDRGKPPTHRTDECLLPPLWRCGPPRWKMYRTIEKHTTNYQNCIPTVGGDFNAELGPGCGTECTSVGKHTLNGANTRGDWMKHWLMLQNFTALNTMYRKNLGKPTTYRSPKGNEKQIDYYIIKRRHLKYNKDAEANDMIHMGSDHRCVMATFMITTPKKDGHRKKKGQARDNKTRQKGSNWKKTLEMRSLSSKKYQEIIETIQEKVEAANKEVNQRKEKRRNKKSSSASKKWENRTGRKRSRWRVLRNRGDERCGDGKRNRWRTILDIAHKRTRRRVPSCSMSDTTWTRERRPPFRMTRLAMKARSRWSTSEKKRSESKLKTWSKQIVLVKNFLSFARERTKRQVPSCYMSATTWMRKKRTTDWVEPFATRMRSWWNSSKKKQMKQQQQKRHLNPMRRSQRKTWKSEDYRGEKNHTQRGETTIEKEVSKQKNASGTRKERKDWKRFNEYSKTSKGLRTSQESNL